MALPTAPSCFGSSSSNVTLPGLFGHPSSDTAHFEAVGSATTTAGVCTILGSISGVNWATITTLTFTSGTGNTPQFFASSAIKYNFYKAALSGMSGGSITAWINS